MLPAEIVIVDQSRSRSARAVVESAAATAPRIEYVPHDALGLGIGQNEAVRRTSSAVVAVLDDDCVAHETWIGEIARVLAPDSPVDVIGGRVLPLGEGGDGTFAVASRTSVEGQFVRSRERPWEVGSGNYFALRRQWFDRIGGCNERRGPGSPGRGAVDIDLFYRLLRAGARARYEPSVIVYHERKTREERLARRIPYGFGMGAASALWLRERDWYAVRTLASWILFRGRLLVAAVRRRSWIAAWEEVLLLVGTARGFVHGLRDAAPPR